MAETVYLKNGSTEVILEDKGDFLEQLIREHLGDDAAQCFAEFRKEIDLAHECTAEQERSADGYYAMCHDALDAFSTVLNLLESPRLPRAALKKAAQAGFDNLNNNL